MKTAFKTIAYVILLLLILLSLGLNVAVIRGLLAVRDSTVEALDQALLALDGLEDEILETTVQVQQTIPIEASVPFQRQWTVPVQVEVPISYDIHFQDTLQVPIETPLFKFDIEVPLDTTIPLNLVVPIDTEVPFAISETIPIHTEVVIDLTVPVVVEMADTPLPGYLGELRDTLTGLQKELQDLPQSLRPHLLNLARPWSSE